VFLEFFQLHIEISRVVLQWRSNQTKTWLVLNTKHRLSWLWHRVVWQAGKLPMIQRSLDFILPFLCTDHTVKTLQALLTCVCQVCIWRFSQTTLFRTADLTFTAFKSTVLITIIAKFLIKSKVRDNDSIRSSFHLTVTASAAAFLHSPLSTVTVPRLYTLHTQPSSWTWHRTVPSHVSPVVPSTVFKTTSVASVTVHLKHTSLVRIHPTYSHTYSF
jgi:hypothetical protein